MASDNELLIKLGVETASASKQIKEITKELKTMEKQVNSVDKSSDGFNSTLANIGKKVDIYSDKIEALNTKLKIHEETLTKTEKTINKTKTELDNLGERTEDNAKKWDTLTKRLENAQIRYNSTVRSIKETQSEISNTSNEIRKLNDSFEDLKFEKFSKELNGLEDDLKLLDKQIDVIDTSTNSFSKNMSGMGDQTTLYRKKIEVLNESIEKHKKELDSTKNSIHQVERWLESLGDKTEDNAEEWNRATDYLEKYSDRHGDLENSLIETQAELRQTTSELQALNVEMIQMPFEKLSNGFDKLSGGLDKISQITQPLTTGVVAIGTGAITTAMSFEQAMAKVQAVSGAAGEDFEKLSAKARQIGGDTQLSASEGAEALLLLAQVGYDTEKSLNAVDATVNLAIANELDLAEATSIVTSALNGFGWESSRATEMVDILSQVSASSSTNVSEMGEAFKTVAPTAHALGFQVEQVATVLGIMANNAITGSEAGNGLKSILANLVAPTKNGAKAMEELGVELVNTDGTMRDLDEIIISLQDGFAKLTEEEKASVAETIVGKQQLSKFLAIVNTGSDDFKDLAKEVENASGKTAEMREIMESTAEGGLKELQSKLEETFIVIGEELLPVFNELVDALGDALVWFQGLDEETQNGIIKFALFSATISPITGILSKVTGGLSSIFTILGKTTGKIAGAVKGVGTLTAGFSSAGATISATSAGSLLGGLTALGTALAPWLLGGAIVVGVGLGVSSLVVGYQNLQKKLAESAEEYSYGTGLVMEANKLLQEDVDEKFSKIQEDMYNFESDGISTLLKAFSNLESGADVDLGAFLETCKTKMNESNEVVQENASEMSKSLEFLNTDIATVFSEKDLATIQDGWARQMTKGMEVAYGSLETTINEKDAIIEGLMVEHGYDYETAYAEWESRVLEQYQIFCDEMIIAQTGYQEESLGALDQYLKDKQLKDRGDYNQSLQFIRDTYAQEASVITEGYAECMVAIQRGETEIQGIKFESAEQAQKYADLTYQYKLNQLALEQEEEIRIATETAFLMGSITEEEYNQLVEASNKRTSLYETQNETLSNIVKSGAEDMKGSWEDVWTAVSEAESKGISTSITRNKDFTDALSVYFASGGKNMSDAIEFAFDSVVGTTEESIKAMNVDFANLDDTVETKLKNVIEWMDTTGVSMDDACDVFDVDSELVAGYMRYLAGEVDDSTTDIDNDLKENEKSMNELEATSKTKTGEVAKNIENMDTRVYSALTNMDGTLVDTADTMDTESGNMINYTKGVSDNFGTMGTRVYGALVDMEGNFIGTAGVVSRESGNIQSDIDSIQGKSVDVTVKFKTINYYDTIAKMQQAQTHVYSAVTGGYKDAQIPTIDFGENYMDDLYGLKDAGIKTLSLASILGSEDGISAYATKDSNATSMVNNSVANYNYTTSPSSFTINAEVPSKTESTESRYEALIHIENMNVRNDSDIKEIAKQLENYIRLHSKKW